jgi:hypothetical protein
MEEWYQMKGFPASGIFNQVYRGLEIIIAIN